jgi:putative transposase
LMHALVATAKQAPAAFPVPRGCQALTLSRATYDRWQGAGPMPAPAMEVRAQIQDIALEMPADGYRRITHEWRRRGVAGNPKRGLRLLRGDNLLCLRTRGCVRTPESAHAVAVSPNPLPELRIAGLDPLWVADMTYVRLPQECISLAVLLDASSRRCIGWALARSLEADLALAALRMALVRRPIRPGLVHHADRGGPEAARAYTRLLKPHGIRIRLSRPGNPYDKAPAESFIKTLQDEEVQLFESASLVEARKRIGHCIEEVDHAQRLHAALGSRPPAAFERLLEP